MEYINIICVSVLALAIGIIAGIKLYKVYRNKKFNINEFIDLYGDKIIDVMKSIVKVLKTSQSEYSTREEYEKAIIELTIEELKQNYKNLGINPDLLILIDSKTLSNMIYDLLHKHSIDIFSVLTAYDITENKNLYDDNVIAAVWAGKIQ